MSQMIAVLASAGLITSIAAGGGPAASITTDTTYHYHHFKDPVAITLDPTRVLLLADENVVPGILDRAGLAPAGFESLARTDARRVVLPAGQRTPDGARAFVENAADDDDVDFVSPIFIDDLGGPMAVLPELFVRFAEGTSAAEAGAILADAGVVEIIDDRRWDQPRLYEVRTASKNGFEVLEIANELAARNDVEFAEPGLMMTAWGHGQVIPNDPGFGNCWGLHNTGGNYNGWTGVADKDMNGPEAWEDNDGIPGIIVAILDTGIQQNHPDIHQVTPGEDTTLFNGNGGPLFEFDNHGTPVGGCVSAIMNNGIGTVGVAPGCRVISIKVAYDIDPGPNWTTASSWIADGVFAANNRGARITNSSFGVNPSSTISLAYDVTYGTGALMHFASTGNGGADSIGDPTIGYPASLGSTNAIAAITPTGVLTSFSNYGPGTHFAAPGTSIWTTDRTGSDGYDGGSYTWFGGTSAASPYAAGVAALAMSANGSLTPQTCGSTMAATAKDLGAGGYDTTYGFGIPDAHGAIILAAYGDDCPGAGSCATDNGTPGCSNAGCCFAICDNDAFCCTVNWDTLCANQAAIACFGCGNAGAGSCFESNGSPACDDADCCQDVCAADTFCCENTWDSICANGAFDLCGAVNDECSTAIVVGEGIHAFSTESATSGGTSPIDCGFIGKDIWYTFVPDCSSNMSVSICQSANFDSKIQIWGPGIIGSSCPSSGFFGGVLMGCSDDTLLCGQGSTLVVPVEAGESYRIRIGGEVTGGVPDSGEGTFTVYCTVPNDTCGFATLIGDGDTPFSNVGASTDGPEHITCDFCCGDDQIGSDIWYKYIATCTGDMTVSTCNDANFDTKLAVYKPVPQGGIGYVCTFGEPLSLVGCNDDAAGCAGFTSELTVPVIAGTTYRIRVGGYNEAQGSGTLNVACSPDVGCDGDIDGSGAIDGADLGLLLGGWGGSGDTDLNGDGTTDGADLGLLLGSWGDC